MIFAFPERRPLLGCSDFCRLIDGDHPFVDKTLLIDEFMTSTSLVTAVLRPRRFGKSTNLSMLSAFFSTHSIEKYRDFFKKCLLGKQNPEIIDHHFRKHPVLQLSLKDCGGSSWDKMYVGIWHSIVAMTAPYRRDLAEQLKGSGIDYSSRKPPKDQEMVVTSLYEIMEALYKKFGMRIIVLVDEYDAPLNHAHRHNFYKEASEFLGRFFSSGFKDNSCLNKAFLVGIVGANGAGLLSGLNNVSVYTVANVEYSRHFGFSRQEIENFLDSNAHMDQIEEWYNGYYCGSQLVINPWSFLNWVCSKRFDSYWVQTAHIESVATVLKPVLNNVLLETFSLLFKEGAESCVTVRALDARVNYADSANVFRDMSSVLHLLVLTGYLTYKCSDVLSGTVHIPNKEVRLHWQFNVVRLAKESKIVGDSDLRVRLEEALRVSPFDSIQLQEAMSQTLSLFSFMDKSTENSYHCFFLGVFGITLHDNIDVFVKSASGNGSFVIFVEFRNQKKLTIFELKKSENQQSLDKDAKDGLNQIFEKKYFQGFDEYYRLLIGVGFHKKSMSSLHFAQFEPGCPCSKPEAVPTSS